MNETKGHSHSGKSENRIEENKKGFGTPSLFSTVFVKLVGLLLEKIVEGLTMAVFNPGRGGTAPLLLDKYFRLKKGAQVVRALVGHTHLHLPAAFISGRRVEVQAVTACVEIRAAVPALVGNLNLIHHLNLGGAVVAACDLVKACFDAAGRPLVPRRRFWLFFTIGILITGLTIFPIH